jgi:hypothetical protein
MRLLGISLIDLQSRDIFFAFEIDNSCFPGARAPWFRFGNSQHEFPIRRFVSDDVFRFERRQKAITNQNECKCRYRFHNDYSDQSPRNRK